MRFTEEKKNKIKNLMDVLYHCTAAGISLSMIIILVTFRPIEPNIIIATVEVVMGLMVIVYACIKIFK
ncbi:unnamed protein product, partial [marine sediment metagenome]